MGLKGFGIGGVGVKCCLAIGRMRTLGGFLCCSSSLFMGLGFLVLLWSCSVMKDWSFGIGAIGFGPSGLVYDLLLFFVMCVLGFRVWCIGRRCEELRGVIRQIAKFSADSGSGFCLDGGVCGGSGVEIQPWKPLHCGCLKRPRSVRPRRSLDGEVRWNGLLDCEEERGEGQEEEGFDDDMEDDIVKLRKMVVKERKLRTRAEMELEKERRAAATAADEAMAKIVLLQNEKSLVEREARQYREMAKQKQCYDHEVIESLQWIILKLEEDRRGGMDLEKPI